MLLSRSEREYLTKGTTGSPDYDRVMKHRIRAKLLKFERDVLPVLKLNGWSKQWLSQVLLSVTENRNITEFSNAGENENYPNNVPFRENVVRGTGFEPANPYGTSPSS